MAEGSRSSTSPVTSEEIAATVAGQTVPRMFRSTVERFADRTALRWKAGEEWRELTFRQYADQACAVAGAFAEMGVRRGTRVGLMMRNRPEFHIADMAALLLGATPVSIYNSSAPEQVEFLLGHCEAAVMVVEDVEYLERVLKVRSELPKLGPLAVVDGEGGVAPDDVVSFSELLRHAPVDFGDAVETAAPDDLVTIIYTSGTTGPPKGVMLDHANACWTAESLRLTMPWVYEDQRRVISYLPMAHIAERVTSHYSGAIQGLEVTTCPEARDVGQYLAAVRPEVFFAVPRVWEKLYAGIQAVAGADPTQKAAFDKTIDLGAQAAEYRARGEDLPAELASTFENVDREALGPVRELLGLDQLLVAISGAAPIPVEIFTFFRGLGVPIAEIYGLSETSGPMTFDAQAVRPGTVGRPIPGQELRLADDGEVCCRGGNIFRGYLNDPAKTAEVLDPDGWFRTGDIGELDADGYLCIVDRKKELIITAGGKNISPANIEASLKACSIIGQVCVIGDRRKFISALIVLDTDVAPVWAEQHGIDDATVEELAAHPSVIAEVQRCVDEVNRQFSQVEQIKRFTLLGEEWQPDSEFLTPTMKLKRRGVLSRYEREIEGMYA